VSKADITNAKANRWKLPITPIGIFADVASFTDEGVPSFYSRESATKFLGAVLNLPCKGKNCGSLNGWLHSTECRVEHESQYTAHVAIDKAEGGAS
jgi:hypothetical protein